MMLLGGLLLLSKIDEAEAGAVAAVDTPAAGFYDSTAPVGASSCTPQSV